MCAFWPMMITMMDPIKTHLRVPLNFTLIELLKPIGEVQSIFPFRLA